MSSITLIGSGMVTGVGLAAPSACAAMRVGIDGFVDTRFMFAGEWLVGCPVPLEGNSGRAKLVEIAAMAIRESAADLVPATWMEIPVILCLAEPDRPGAMQGLDESLLGDIQRRLGVRLHASSTIIRSGRVSGVRAFDQAHRLIGDGRRYCIVAGVDSYLVRETLEALYEMRLLKTAANSDGFVPGEAAAAVLVSASNGRPDSVECVGIGYGTEEATVTSEKPFRADGMVTAFRSALTDARITWSSLHYRISDVSGGQYAFKEAALALDRTLREHKNQFPIWHPADCIGEVGAAFGPMAAVIAATAARKGYAPGTGVLCHFSNPGSERAAMILLRSARDGH